MDSSGAKRLNESVGSGPRTSIMASSAANSANADNADGRAASNSPLIGPLEPPTQGRGKEKRLSDPKVAPGPTGDPSNSNLYSPQQQMSVPTSPLRGGPQEEKDGDMSSSSSDAEHAEDDGAEDDFLDFSVGTAGRMALLKEGCLSKRHRKQLWYGWHKRYFVLKEPGYILYYKTKKQTHRRGFISLNQNFTVDFPGTYNPKRKGWQFNVLGPRNKPGSTRTQTISMCADTEEEAKSWVQVISDCIEKRPPPAPSAKKKEKLEKAAKEQKQSEKDTRTTSTSKEPSGKKNVPDSKEAMQARLESTIPSNKIPESERQTAASESDKFSPNVKHPAEAAEKETHKEVDTAAHKEYVTQDVVDEDEDWETRANTIKKTKTGVEGWLWRKHKSRKLWTRWHRRYIELRNNSLLFYRDGRKSGVRDKVTFGGDTRVSIVQSMKSGRKKLFIFSVYLEVPVAGGGSEQKSIMLLGSRQQEEAETWCEQIQLSIHGSGPEAPEELSTIVQIDDAEDEAIGGAPSLVSAEADKQTSLGGSGLKVRSSRLNKMPSRGSEKGSSGKQSAPMVNKGTRASSQKLIIPDPSQLPFPLSTSTSTSIPTAGLLVIIAALYMLLLKADWSPFMLKIFASILMLTVACMPYLTFHWVKRYLEEAQARQIQLLQRAPTSQAKDSGSEEEREVSEEFPSPKDVVPAPEVEFDDGEQALNLSIEGSLVPSSPCVTDFDSDQSTGKSEPSNPLRLAKYKVSTTGLDFLPEEEKQAAVIDPKKSMRWGETKGSNFNCRVGNYAQEKKKAPSVDGIYTPIAVDLLSTESKIEFIARFMDFSAVPQETLDKIIRVAKRVEACTNTEENGFQLPALVIVHYVVPDYAPQFFKKVEDGLSLSMPIILLLKESVFDFLDEKNMWIPETPVGYRLFEQFIHTDYADKFRNRWKVITTMTNPEHANLNSVEWALFRKYNSTPWLVMPQDRYNDSFCTVPFKHSESANSQFETSRNDLSESSSDGDSDIETGDAGAVSADKGDKGDKGTAERKRTMSVSVEFAGEKGSGALPPAHMNVACHEMTIDVHHFSYFARSSANNAISRLDRMGVDVGLVIEARETHEMPEQVFACLYLHRLDLTKAFKWPKLKNKTPVKSDL